MRSNRGAAPAWLASVFFAACAGTPPRSESTPATPAHAAHAISVIEPAPSIRGETVVFHDGFDGPAGTDLTWAIQATRPAQSGTLAPGAWTRLPGVWFDAPPAPDAQVTREASVGGFSGAAMCFHGNSAARLEVPIEIPAGFGIAVSALVDPSTGDEASLSWVSFVLTEDPRSRGWVTDRDATPGLLVRSNGAIQLFSRGNEARHQWDADPAAASAVHRIEFRVLPHDQGAGLQLTGSLDGHRFRSTLPATPDVSRRSRVVRLEIGAHYHGEGPPPSCVDDVRVTLFQR